MLYYWGGVKDLEKKIRKATGGRPVFTAAVGPFRPAEPHASDCASRT